MITIETSLFALCLEDSSPGTLDDRFRNILHGDGKNRWFDKSFQLIVGRNGKFGGNGEHSGLDGYPVYRLIRFIYDQLRYYCFNQAVPGLQRACRHRFHYPLLTEDRHPHNRRNKSFLSRSIFLPWLSLYPKRPCKVDVRTWPIQRPIHSVFLTLIPILRFSTLWDNRSRPIVHGAGAQ